VEIGSSFAPRPDTVRAMQSDSANSKQEGALPALLALRTEKDFEELLSTQPELLDEATVAMVLEFDDLPGYGTVLRALASLLREGRNDTAVAWARYDKAMQASKDPDGVLKAEVEKAQVALAAGRGKEALALIDAAGDRADSIGDGPLWAALQGLRGRVILGPRRRPSRSAGVRSALFVVAASLSSGDQQTAAIIDLAGVSISRIREDPAENVEHGLALMRLVMRELDDDAPTWLRARGRQVLIKALLKQERGDQVAPLREILALTEEGVFVKPQFGFDPAFRLSKPISRGQKRPYKDSSGQICSHLCSHPSAPLKAQGPAQRGRQDRRRPPQQAASGAARRV
jgi:hypothetical protein